MLWFAAKRGTTHVGSDTARPQEYLAVAREVYANGTVGETQNAQGS